jgi:uncharacterized membrane protein HdeD (DUF308 family)
MFLPSSRLVNLAVGVIMILGGISQFFPPSMSSIIVGVYVIIFGLSMFSPSLLAIAAMPQRLIST